MSLRLRPLCPFKDRDGRMNGWCWDYKNKLQRLPLKPGVTTLVLMRPLFGEPPFQQDGYSSPWSHWYSLRRLSNAGACCQGRETCREGMDECSASTQQMLGDQETQVQVRKKHIESND